MSIQPIDCPNETSSSNLTRQATLYSLVAAAASVSMLALAQPAESEVVVTKKTIPILLSDYDGVRISLTNNGIDDFTFYLFASDTRTSTGNGKVFSELVIGNGKDGRGVVGGSRGSRLYASALRRGVQVGPSAKFVSSSIAARIEEKFESGAVLGKWGGNPKDRYLGVRFLINGATHYGWVRLTVITEPKLMSATITGYAYETVANKPIFAGTAEKPTAEAQVPESLQSQAGPSIGMLALGSQGLTLWRGPYE